MSRNQERKQTREGGVFILDVALESTLGGLHDMQILEPSGQGDTSLPGDTAGSEPHSTGASLEGVVVFLSIDDDTVEGVSLELDVHSCDVAMTSEHITSIQGTPPLNRVNGVFLKKKKGEWMDVGLFLMSDMAFLNE